MDTGAADTIFTIHCDGSLPQVGGDCVENYSILEVNILHCACVSVFLCIWTSLFRSFLLLFLCCTLVGGFDDPVPLCRQLYSN